MVWLRPWVRGGCKLLPPEAVEGLWRPISGSERPTTDTMMDDCRFIWLADNVLIISRENAFKGEAIFDCFAHNEPVQIASDPQRFPAPPFKLG